LSDDQNCFPMWLLKNLRKFLQLILSPDKYPFFCHYQKPQLKWHHFQSTQYPKFSNPSRPTHEYQVSSIKYRVSIFERRETPVERRKIDQMRRGVRAKIHFFKFF
jgi:hypothetical protein